MKRALAATALCLGLLAGAAPASAATFAESGDAGGTRATAAGVNVSPLTSITGTVADGGDRDLFRICLTGGAFIAQTSSTGDPILGLFREDGTLVAENDDFGSLESRIDESFGEGVFFLAITAFPNRSVDADTGTSVEGSSFTYTIDLTGAAPCPASVPTFANQCKKGGFRNFGGLFKNQGDCVSFVKTGGKNQPNG